ncbi:MAG: hypothetical protein EXR93_07840 [Gemmatimonadetes bacterium]|nr:hypothetical protein [Gemmatimonadota bacterium]
MRRATFMLAAGMTLIGTSVAQAQGSVAGQQRSSNVHIEGHLVGRFTDIDIEQELSRPYIYMTAHQGFDIISIKDTKKPFILYSWSIENKELHDGNGGALSPIYLKSKGRYYYANSFQYRNGTGPDQDLGAVIFDVTGLPDTTKIKELARIKVPEGLGGMHESFGYRHSSGRSLLVTSTYTPYAYIYDIDQVVSGGPNRGVIGKIPMPDSASLWPPRMGNPRYAYHDMVVQYDAANKRDLFYGGSQQGYYVYDITELANPKVVATISGVSGVTWGHTFTPDPTGRYVVTEAEYQYAPLRLFDLKPALDGTAKTISRPIGAWTASWKGLPHNHEVRWPYVFVSTYADEFYVFNMMDPTNPYTVGFHDTAPGVDLSGESTFGVDVRNADGLVVTSGGRGLWMFKMDGFDGWNGHQWGLPNVSTAQDWDNGPDGAPKPQKVSAR